MSPCRLFLLVLVSVSVVLPAAAQYTSSVGTFSTPLGINETGSGFGDEVWLVSSRRLTSRNRPVASIDVWKKAGNAWANSSMAAFAQPDPNGVQRPVVIMVHGNSWSMDTAIKRGMQTYREIIVPWQGRPPIRFVIWTWPSDKIAGPIRNIRVKADLADDHAFHLARFTGELAAHPRISMMGYSYGARVTLGALDLLGGGCVKGCRVSTPPVPDGCINVSLIAPGIRNDALLTTRSQAYRKINHLFVMYNSRDRLLKFFKFTRFDGKTPALGFTGLAGKSRLPNSMLKIDQFDAAQQVGVEHDYLNYLENSEVERRLQRNLLYELLPN